ncbi:MAG: MOSC domain-containing protein [Anaerolineae bacterium]|nr:MOSC domain-containing protein [Anaerolineae bacterium]
MGTVVSIAYRPDEVPAHPADHYSRVALPGAQLVENYGIEGDRKGGNPSRNLNIMAQESIDTLAAEGFKAQPGELGEQIIITGLGEDLNTLPEGTQLLIGDQAVVEVGTPRTGCDRFQAIQGIDPAQAAGRLGVMARVVKDGRIQVGDRIQIVQDVRVRQD